MIFMKRKIKKAYKQEKAPEHLYDTILEKANQEKTKKLKPVETDFIQQENKGKNKTEQQGRLIRRLSIAFCAVASVGLLFMFAGHGIAHRLFPHDDGTCPFCSEQQRITPTPTPEGWEREPVGYVPNPNETPVSGKPTPPIQPDPPDPGVWKTWEEKTEYERYTNLNFEGVEYQVSSIYGAFVPMPEEVGEVLGTAILSGLDPYQDIRYETEAEVYSIQSISSDCAIAVKFEGLDGYQAYKSSKYRPETLGSLLEDLSLQENAVLGKLWTNSDMTVYEGITPESFFDMLAKNAGSLYEEPQPWRMHTGGLSFAIDIPLLAVKNLSIQVHEDGYITTNIMDFGYEFYVGQDVTQAYFTYVRENKTGEITYDSDPAPIMEPEATPREQEVPSGQTVNAEPTVTPAGKGM